jgi:hypothetical protein
MTWTLQTFFFTIPIFAIFFKDLVRNSSISMCREEVPYLWGDFLFFIFSNLGGGNSGNTCFLNHYFLVEIALENQKTLQFFSLSNCHHGLKIHPKRKIK